MKFYESLQANSGQLIAGVGIPGTDIEVSRPPIPFAEVDFDNNTLAVVGTLALAGGIVGAIRHKRTTNDLIENTQFPAGSDQAERVHRNIVRGRRKGIALGLLATGVISAGLYEAADPHTNEKVNEIDSIAVIVDAGYEGYTEDVAMGNGETSNRINATVNSLKQLEFDGIDVTFIAAGSTPENMGMIEDGRGRKDIIENFTDYTSVFSQRGSAANGGGDIETALSIAGGLNPDKILVFAGTLQGNEQSPVLRGEELDGNNRVSVIAVGKSGSTVESLGTEVPAPVESAYNEIIVGTNDSYTAESTDELKNVVNQIIKDQVQSDERHDVKFFEKMRNGSAVALGALSFAIFGLEGRRPKVIKKRK